jgi:hypothetical protein
VWWREHVRGRGAAIVGTSGDLPSVAPEKGRKKVAKPRGKVVILSLFNENPAVFCCGLPLDAST